MGKKYGSKERNTISRKERFFSEKGEVKILHFNNRGYDL